MEINLSEQVVILDEAHNIEDSAREAASFKFNVPRAFTDTNRRGLFDDLVESASNGVGGLVPAETVLANSIQLDNREYTSFKFLVFFLKLFIFLTPTFSLNVFTFI